MPLQDFQTGHVWGVTDVTSIKQIRFILAVMSCNYSKYIQILLQALFCIKPYMLSILWSENILYMDSIYLVIV